MKLFNSKNKKKARPTDEVAAASNRRALRNGSYTLLIGAVVLAAVVLFNLIVRALPSTYTQLDLSTSKLYTLGSDSTTLAQGLTQDVTIYYLAQSGSEDAVVTRLLDRYAAASSHLSWTQRDPAVYPTFASQYGAGNASSGSLIVVSGERSRVVDASSLYETDYSSYYTTGTAQTSFDGEQQITAAILYVTSEDTPVVYALTGHGEAELSSSLQTAIANQNLELQTASVLTLEEIGSEVQAVILNNPTVDYTTDDVQLLREYLEQGGDLLLTTDSRVDTPNLDALLAEYGMSRTEGLVVEGDANYCMGGYNYYLFPQLASNDWTSAMEGRYFLAPLAQGVELDSENENVTLTQLMTTSSAAYSKLAGAQMTTTEKEEGDLDGPFCIAALAENESTGGRILWLSTPGALDEQIDSYSAGGNSTFVLSALNRMCESTTSIVIEAKSTSSESLVVPASGVMLWGLVFVIVLPLLLLVTGIAVVVIRRRK